MKKPLRVVIVGCGYFGQKRILACTRLPNSYTIVGVVDTDSNRAATAGKQLGVPHASSLTNLLKTIQADIAIVSIPNKYHAAVVIEALKHRLHVLCEKPLTTTFAGAQKIVVAAKKYGRYVKTGSNHRFFPTMQKAAEIIQSGKIGRIIYIKGDIGTNGSHTKKSWFWDKSVSGGGTLIDNACHLLDIIRWFMGDFASCTGSIGNVYWKQTSVEDVAGAIYQTNDNRLAVVTSSWIQWTGYMSIDIWGDHGYLLIDSKRGNTITLGINGETQQTVFDFSSKPLSSYDDELLYFADCINNKKEPRPNANDGAQVIKMIEGIYTSAKKRKSVRLS